MACGGLEGRRHHYKASGFVIQSMDRAPHTHGRDVKIHTTNIRAHQFYIHAADGPSGLLIDQRNHFSFLGNQTIDFGGKCIT
jgi:hypothetical protein